MQKMRVQNLDSLSGKILRIHPLTGDGYADNPFYNGDPTHNRSKVYSYGLRNPFRFSVHPQTNEPFVGDVGWTLWEEIHSGRGKNFGWPCYEGRDGGVSEPQAKFRDTAATRDACAALYAQGPGAVHPPAYAYAHNGQGAAIVTGPFYQGNAYPTAYQGCCFSAITTTTGSNT